MRTKSDYVGRTAYCYPEQGMVDRLLCGHMQIPEGLWAWETLDYNTSNVWTALFSMPDIQTVAWTFGVHRQAAAGHSSQATINQGQSQGSQKKPRYDLRSSKKPRTEKMNIR